MLLWDCLHFIQAIPHFCKKNGGEGVNFQPLIAKLKNRYFTLNYPQLWHFIAHHLQSPEINKTGKKWGSLILWGESEKVYCLPISQSPNRESNHHPY